MGISRQPAVTPRLTTNMLIGSAVCQTPAIFSMVVALMLIFMNFTQAPLGPTWAALVGAGFSTGLAAIGSGYGGGLAAGASCEGISRQPESVGNVTTVMLVGQAVAQTPSIFGERTDRARIHPPLQRRRHRPVLAKSPAVSVRL